MQPIPTGRVLATLFIFGLGDGDRFDRISVRTARVFTNVGYYGLDAPKPMKMM